MAETLAIPASRGRALLAIGLVAVAFNLRDLFASMGTLLAEASRGDGLSALGASLVTMLPVLCLGIFAPLAPPLARRLGTEWTVMLALAAIALGTGMRGLAPASALFAGSILAGLGIAVANVLLPGIIKRDFADRTAGAMGLYSMLLCVSGTLGAGVSAPLMNALGGSWRAALGFWAWPALAAAVIWLPQLARRNGADRGGHGAVRGLWRNGLAWQVTLFMAFQSAGFYAGLGWLPELLRERGLGTQQAGYVMSVSIFLQIVAALAAPPLAARGRDQRLATLASMLITAAGIAGYFYGPMSGIWLWAALLGLGQGAAFAVALTLIVLRASDAQVAAQLSSMVQTVGYIVAAFGSLIAGMVYDWTGGWGALALLFFALVVVGAISGWGAGRSELIRAG